MIRFTDVVPDAKPKKAAAPTPESEPADSAAPVTPKPTKSPRKAKKSA